MDLPHQLPWSSTSWPADGNIAQTPTQEVRSAHLGVRRGRKRDVGSRFDFIVFFFFLTVYPCLVFTSLLVTYNSFQLHKDTCVLPTFLSRERSRQQLHHTSALKIKANSIPCRDNKWNMFFSSSMIHLWTQPCIGDMYSVGHYQS